MERKKTLISDRSGRLKSRNHYLVVRQKRHDHAKGKALHCPTCKTEKQLEFIE